MPNTLKLMNTGKYLHDMDDTQLDDGPRLEHITRGRRVDDWGRGRWRLHNWRRVDKRAVADSILVVIGALPAATLLLLSEIVNLLVGVFCAPADADRNVRVGRVHYRHKLDVMRLASHRDFGAIRNEYCTADILMDEHWMLYAVERHVATFVRMPDTGDAYNARRSAFLYIDQYKLCTHVATMPLDDFVQWSLTTVGQPKGQVVIQTNTGRAGTTLMAALMHIPGHTVSFSEPDPLYCLSALVTNHALGDTHAAYAPILRAIMNATCKNQDAYTAYVIKPRCFGNAILPLYQYIPYAKHIFLYRENTNLGCRSMVRSFMSRPLLNASYQWKTVGVPFLERLWMQGSNIEKAALVAAKARTIWEYGAIVYAVQHTYFLDTLADNDDVLSFSYEDLIGDTRSTLQRIYAHCHWDAKHIEESLQVLTTDSQRHSPLARHKLARHDAAEFPLSVERARELAWVLRLEEDFFLPHYRFHHRAHPCAMRD